MRDKILGACRDLAHDRGFHGLSMDGLAARAGVSKRTLYRYFPGKEALIEATLEDFMAQVALEVARITREEPDPTRMLSAIQKYLFLQGQFVTNPRSFRDLKEYYPYLWQKIDRFRLQLLATVLDHIRLNLASATANHIDPRIAAAVILTSIQTVLNPEFVVANNLTFDETLQQLSRLLMDGFMPR